MAKQSRILERDAAVCSKIEMTYFTGVRPMNETFEVKFAQLIIFKTFRRATAIHECYHRDKRADQYQEVPIC